MEQMKMPDAQQSHLEYVKGLPLREALWWFIENSHDELPERTELFFALRERVRATAPQGPDAKQIATRILAETDDESILDSVVHNECSAYATGVNNDGMEAQVEYLLANGWSEALIRKEAGLDQSPNNQPASPSM